MYNVFIRQDHTTNEPIMQIRPAPFNRTAIIGFRLFAVTFSILLQRMIVSRYYKSDEISAITRILLAMASYAVVATLCQVTYIISMYLLAFGSYFIECLYVRRHHGPTTRITRQRILS